MNENNINENSILSDIQVSNKMSYCNGRFVKMAAFAAKTETPFMIIGLLLGFFIFLLPSIHEGARQALHEWPFLYAIFDAGVRLRPAFVSPLLLLVLYSAFVHNMVITKGFPGRTGMHHETSLPTAKSVMSQSFFPSSKKEAIVFLHWFFLGILLIYFWFSLFALLSYFIRIGGVK